MTAALDDSAEIAQWFNELPSIDVKIGRDEQMFDGPRSDLAKVDALLRTFIASGRGAQTLMRADQLTRPEHYLMRKRCTQIGVHLSGGEGYSAKLIVFRPEGWFPGYALNSHDETDERVVCACCDETVDKRSAMLSLGIMDIVCVQCEAKHEAVFAHKSERLDDLD